MQKTFDKTTCQTKVTRFAKAALEYCTPELVRRLARADAGEGDLRGTEQQFDAAFENVAGKHLHKSRATTAEMGVPDSAMVVRDTTKGFIDCVLNFDGHLIGFEHKIVRLPRRSRNAPEAVLYDLWQICADHYRLEMARKLSGGYCTIILHGPLVSDAKSVEAVYRHFWNCMFLDYAVSLNWGELARAKNGNELGVSKKWQLANIKRLHFDKPYAEVERPMDFRVRNKDRTLAVLGLWAERRGRLQTVFN